MSSMFHARRVGAQKSTAKADALEQVAALCHRDSKSGTEVLLITSSSGRWILPKGWPMKGISDAEAAKQEAWEEAGVKKAKVADAPIGRFTAQKEFDNGAYATCKVTVFPLAVKETKSDFPEAKKRTRVWVSLGKAAKMVQEPGLQRIIRSFQPTE